MLFTAQDCYDVVAAWEEIDATYSRWVIDCWRTFGDWIIEHPLTTEDEQDAQWTAICLRPEGEPYRLTTDPLLDI